MAENENKNIEKEIDELLDSENIKELLKKYDVVDTEETATAQPLTEAAADVPNEKRLFGFMKRPHRQPEEDALPDDMQGVSDAITGSALKNSETSTGNRSVPLSGLPDETPAVTREEDRFDAFPSFLHIDDFDIPMPQIKSTGVESILAEFAQLAGITDDLDIYLEEDIPKNPTEETIPAPVIQADGADSTGTAESEYPAAQEPGMVTQSEARETTPEEIDTPEDECERIPEAQPLDEPAAAEEVSEDSITKPEAAVLPEETAEEPDSDETLEPEPEAGTEETTDDDIAAQADTLNMLPAEIPETEEEPDSEEILEPESEADTEETTDDDIAAQADTFEPLLAVIPETEVEPDTDEILEPEPEADTEETTDDDIAAQADTFEPLPAEIPETEEEPDSKEDFQEEVKSLFEIDITDTVFEDPLVQEESSAADSQLAEEASPEDLPEPDLPAGEISVEESEPESAPPPIAETLTPSMRIIYQAPDGNHPGFNAVPGNTVQTGSGADAHQIDRDRQDVPAAEPVTDFLATMRVIYEAPSEPEETPPEPETATVPDETEEALPEPEPAAELEEPEEALSEPEPAAELEEPEEAPPEPEVAAELEEPEEAPPEPETAAVPDEPEEALPEPEPAAVPDETEEALPEPELAAEPDETEEALPEPELAAEPDKTEEALPEPEPAAVLNKTEEEPPEPETAAADSYSSSVTLADLFEEANKTDETVKDKKSFKKRLVSLLPQKSDGTAEIIRKIILIISILTMIVCGVILLNNYVISPYLNRVQKEKAVEVKINSSLMKDWSAANDKYSDINFPVGMQLKYAELYVINRDFTGWLEIPGVGIDMPIVQGDNNADYLKKSFYNEKSKYGCCFVDTNNNIAELDRNTIIYGHNTRNGSGTMFVPLEKLRTVEGFKAAPLIEFNTLYADYKWKVYAVFITNGGKDGDNGYVFNYIFKNLSSNDIFSTYIKQIDQRKLYTTGVDIRPTDKILTLSTCCYDFDDARLVVIARLIRAGESEHVNTSIALTNKNPRYPQGWYSAKGIKNPYADEGKWLPS